MKTGVIKFSGIAMMEGVFSFLGTTIVLKGKAAFVDPLTGKTHGSTDVGGGWSKETLMALDALRELMENDLARVHFESDGESVAISRGPTQGGPTGIKEALGSDEGVPQV